MYLLYLQKGRDFMPRHSVIVLSETPFGTRNYIVDLYRKPYLYGQNFQPRDHQAVSSGIRLQFPTDIAAHAFMECRHLAKYKTYVKYEE